MSVDRQLIVAGIYDALNARDLDELLEHLAPEVEWAHGIDGGREHSRAGVRAFWEKTWKEVNPLIEPMEMQTVDGAVHVRVQQFVTSLAGAVLQNKKVGHIFSFDGPFVTRLDVIDADPNPEADDDEDGDA
ncbi:MAG: nuclear transport factor 2 family protein [Bauldia sp.]|nr:nuclear transport factor 2 family protein [Bauldia sp.]